MRTRDLIDDRRRLLLPLGVAGPGRHACVAVHQFRFDIAAKNTEFRDRIAELNLQAQAADQNRQEQAEIAQKVFELSQSLAENWLDADCRAKRHLLRIVCLNFRSAQLWFRKRENPPASSRKGFLSRQVGVTRHQLNYSAFPAMESKIW
jgi:hypothetical protein